MDNASEKRDTLMHLTKCCFTVSLCIVSLNHKHIYTMFTTMGDSLTLHNNDSSMLAKFQTTECSFLALHSCLNYH